MVVAGVKGRESQIESVVGRAKPRGSKRSEQLGIIAPLHCLEFSFFYQVLVSVHPVPSVALRAVERAIGTIEDVGGKIARRDLRNTDADRHLSDLRVIAHFGRVAKALQHRDRARKIDVAQDDDEFLSADPK